MNIWSIAKFIAENELKPQTHMRVQKLSFYGYGALVALGRNIPQIEWRARKSGPVNRDLAVKLQDFGADPIHQSFWAEIDAPDIDGLNAEILNQVLDVYGILETWELRDESQLEYAWASTNNGQTIAHTLLESWARETFVNNIRLPEMATGAAWLEFEGIQRTKYSSFEALAKVTSRVMASINMADDIKSLKCMVAGTRWTCGPDYIGATW